MGHLRLNGGLPNTKPWREVVGKIADGADPAAVAAAATTAAVRGLLRAKADPVVAHTVFLLARTALAARDDDFPLELTKVNIHVPPDPGLFDLTAQFTAALEARYRRTRVAWSDLGEMAALAGVEALVRCVGERARGLFPTPDEVRDAARELSTRNGFAYLAHAFFARFTHRFLLYHLERELPFHVGGNGRFADTTAHSQFLDDLEVHTREVALIVRAYAGDWYEKARFVDGISEGQARRFADHCLTKLAADLALRGGRDG